MSNHRTLYLAKSRLSPTQRAHFGLFIPSSACDRPTLATDYKSQSSYGTIIHVVGEPLMSGFALQFKRNFETSSDHDLSELILLGQVDGANVYDGDIERGFCVEDMPRGKLEREATFVTPPPKGQNVRAPIDGVRTRRCQEWTMEFLKRLAAQGLVDEAAVERAEKERDPPTLGIFGFKA